MPGGRGDRIELPVDPGSEAVRRTRLASGLRVVTETLPDLRSVAVGFWVGTGARDEQAGLVGASHFLEHLLFKGTATRSARAIADAVESVGGDMNAFTTHEHTAFYVRVPDTCLELALDILSEVVWTPALRDDDIESERHVILEEIRMREDTPDDLVHDLFASAVFPEHPLGHAVVGTVESIGRLPSDAVRALHAAHYQPGNVVVAAAGRLSHDDVVARIAALAPGGGDRPPRADTALSPPRARAVVERATEQVHLVTGVQAFARDDPDRYALAVLNQVLGGGMSSRLFQEVRERRGLAYSVFSYRSAYTETGALGFCAGTAPERFEETLAVIEGELERIVEEGTITPEELDRARGHLVGSLALGLESSASRMHRIGRSELTLGEVPSIDTVAADIEAVTLDDVARVVDRVLRGAPRTLAIVGPRV